MVKKVVKKSNAGIVILAAVALIAVAAAIYAVKSGVDITAWFAIKDSKETDISFDTYGNTTYAYAGDSFLAASASGIQLFDVKGNEKAVVPTSINLSAVDSGSKYAAVWDIGGKAFWIFSNKELVFEKETDDYILNIAVNKNGWFAVNTEQSDYKGVITIYNSSFNPVYQWYSGEGYILDCAIADDNKTIAILTAESGRSRVAFYDVDSEQLRSEYYFDNELFIDIEYVSNGFVEVISSDRSVFLNENAELLEQYDYSGRYLVNYCVGEDGITVLVFSQYQNGGDTTLVTLNNSGKLLKEQNSAEEVAAISAASGRIAVLYHGRAAIYTSYLEEMYSYTDTEGVTSVILMDKDTVILTTGYGASVVELK